MRVRFASVAVMLVASAAAAMAQPGARSPSGLDLPEDVQFIGPARPRLRPTATIVNGETISAADVDQRVALTTWLHSIRLAPDQAESFRARILRDLIDEALWLQTAAAAGIRVETGEVDRLYERVASNDHHTYAEFGSWLHRIGSSEQAVKRQLRGALATRRWWRSQITDTIPDEDGDRAAAIASLTDVYRAADPDRVEMSLIRLSLALPADANEDLAQYRVRELSFTTGGCGHALAAAWRSQAEISLHDRVAAGELPPALQREMLALGPGMASRPFRAQDRVSVLILCSRDELPEATTLDETQLEEQRIRRRAQRYIRELRRDAVIDYR